MSWDPSPVTQFSLAALIILLVSSVFVALKFIFFPVWPAKFGVRSTLPGGQAAGVDPSNPYFHWSLRVGSLWLVACLQALIWILLISGLGADVYSIADAGDSNGYSYYSVSYGTLSAQATGYSRSSYSSSSIDGSVPWSTFRAAAAFTLIFGLVAIIATSMLAVKLFLLGCCGMTVQWTESMFQCVQVQQFSLMYAVLIWALGAHVMLVPQTSVSIALASSWSLMLTCFVLTTFVWYFVRLAIEYRTSGGPVLLPPAPVAQIMVVQQQPMFVGQQPQMVYAQGPYPGPMMQQQQFRPQQQQFQPQPQFQQQQFQGQPQQLGSPQGGYPQQAFAPQPYGINAPMQNNYAQPNYNPGQSLLGPQQPQQQQPYDQPPAYMEGQTAEGSPQPDQPRAAAAAGPREGSIPVTFAEVRKQ